MRQSADISCPVTSEVTETLMIFIEYRQIYQEQGHLQFSTDVGLHKNK